MSRRSGILLGVAVVLLGLCVFAWWYTRPLPILTVTTWPGDYGRAQAIAMFHPFGESNRTDVRIAQYDGGLDHLKSEVTSRNYDWDVIDLELHDAVEACHEGLLKPIDPASLPAGADGTAAHEDFVADAIGPCWVGSVVFSQVMVYARDRVHGDAPKTVKDFFDLARFPGPRALHRDAKLNLELALLADGVESKDVYPMLSTDAGLKRALAKLSSVRDSVVWWSEPGEPLQMLGDGRAVMATALNGNVFDAVSHNRPVGAVWDGQLYELDVFGIPKGDPRGDRALDFIRFATSSSALSHVAEWVPYGPARRSAEAGVGKNPETGVAMAPYLPTAHFANALAVDDEWWREHRSTIEPVWQTWLAKGT